MRQWPVRFRGTWVGTWRAIIVATVTAMSSAGTTSIGCVIASATRSAASTSMTTPQTMVMRRQASRNPRCVSHNRSSSPALDGRISRVTVKAAGRGAHRLASGHRLSGAFIQALRTNSCRALSLASPITRLRSMPARTSAPRASIERLVTAVCTERAAGGIIPAMSACISSMPRARRP